MIHYDAIEYFIFKIFKIGIRGKVMFNKRIDTNASIHELISARWSGRAYDPNRMLSRQQIISLLEAARWAPSCYGYQPWRYIVCDKASNESSWSKALECLAEGNQVWAKNASLLLLACADSKNRNNDENRWGVYDTGSASENLCLQATALGLMAHQMGGFSVENSINYFNIPKRFTPMAMISIGYQLAENEISETMKEREYSDRVRNSLGMNFFEGAWAEPILLSN